ncbi:MAG: mannitol dehydrogenase family protein [Ilumatobacter sp.]|nr:mannitol dehydrogenase family protein [Ilumatobacter sp.]
MTSATPTTPLHDLADADLATLPDTLEAPSYQRSALTPSIVHLGVGGFHRAHLAVYVDDLCQRGNTDWAIVGAGVMPGDVRMADALLTQRGLYALISRGAETTTRIIGSIVDFVHVAGLDDTDGADELIARIADPATKIVSLTITEGGYPVHDDSGLFDADRAANSAAFQILVRGLDRRRRSGGGPLTVVSCDNIVHNGRVTRTATIGVADTVGDDLTDWIREHVRFPNSMVDRITPATTDADREWLAAEHGLVDRWPVVAEPFRQWVLEDDFATAMPPFADVGVLVTDDVEPYEILKLRMLNASHSCLAYLAALAGFQLVDEVLRDDDFREFVGAFMRDEAAPVLPAVPGVDVAAYAAELLERFANPAIGDQIARLCLDGSSKFPKFLLPTVRAQLDAGGSIRFAALALAGWCRYLQGRDDGGHAIELAHDPLLADLTGFAAAADTDPAVFLSNKTVFGDDLGADARFAPAFVDAFTSLQASGVRSTVAACIGR